MSHLKVLFNDVMSDRTTIESILEHPAILELEKLLNELKASCKKSRTGKLWISFMEFISICRLFIRAERTGNWLLHLKATQDMLPYFAANGHNNYAKCCRLYLQDAQNLCGCMNDEIINGFFTVRRNKSKFWSGTWSDMIIEQCLMRNAKTSGGLINITHREAAKTVWLLASHVLAQYSDGIRVLTGKFSGTWSAQHREMSAARINTDVQHMEKFYVYLKNHNPFIVPENTLMNISTGLIADERVNVDKVSEIGKKINESITGKTVGDVKFKKSDQVVSFTIMKKGVLLDSTEKIHISSDELSQRLIAIASHSHNPDPSLYAYELSPVAPAIFNDEGLMRKSPKSQLMNYILGKSPDICLSVEAETRITVIDGCAVLQMLPWPKVGTVKDSCLLFTSYICSNYLKFPDQQPIVVFDSYEVSTTKDPEQKKRKKTTAKQTADVMLHEAYPIPSDKISFLSNKKNKQSYIKLLEMFLTEKGVAVHHAGEEGDADVVIADAAVTMAESYGENVKVISDDTDILVLLLHHAKISGTIYMKTKTKFIDITAAKNVIGDAMCACLPAIHAISGCDTTSSFFQIGKLKPMKLAETTPEFQRSLQIFGDSKATKEEIGQVGEKFIICLYGGKKNIQTLDELRYMNMMSTKYVPLNRLPPTSRSALFHCLRAHLQTSTWRCLQTKLDPEQYGFRSHNGELIAVITDKKPAPDELLKEIRCSCSKGEKLCLTCNCAKKRLQCSIHCKCGGECENSFTFASVGCENAEILCE